MEKQQKHKEAQAMEQPIRFMAELSCRRKIEEQKGEAFEKESRKFFGTSLIVFGSSGFRDSLFF